MFNRMKKSALLIATLASFGAYTQAIHAQSLDYPNKQVRIIVASAPGGPVDVAARILSQKLSDEWKQAVIVENRPGASEMIGADYVAKSPADGYTLLVISLNPLTINPAVFPKMPYDPDKSFTSIGSITVNPMALVAGPSAPFNNFKDMVAASKQKPDGLSWSTPGLATGNHIAGEWIKSETGAKMVHVPYTGGPAAANAIMSGDVPMGVVSFVQALPFVKAGKMKVIAITSEKRSPLAPDWPTVAETAIPGFDASVRSAMFAPAATPKAIVAKINADMNRILQLPELRDKFAATGAEPWVSSPQELDATIAKIRQKVTRIIEVAKITAQ